MAEEYNPEAANRINELKKQITDLEEKLLEREGVECRAYEVDQKLAYITERMKALENNHDLAIGNYARATIHELKTRKWVPFG
jgi:hypothetical protein